MIYGTLLLWAAWSHCHWYWWQNPLFVVFVRIRIGLPCACSIEIGWLLRVAVGVQWFLTPLSQKAASRVAPQQWNKHISEWEKSTLQLYKFTSEIQIPYRRWQDGSYQFWRVTWVGHCLWSDPGLRSGDLALHYSWWPGGMGGARWSLQRRVGRSPDAVTSVGVAEGCGVTRAGWRPGSQDGHLSRGGDHQGVLPAGTSSSMCRTRAHLYPFY